MARPNKYLKGPKLNFEQLTTELVANRYVFLHGRPCHPSWLKSMRFNNLWWFAAQGFFHQTLINPKYSPKIRVDPE